MAGASDDGVQIRIEPFSCATARALVDEAMADLGVRYGGGGDDTPVDPTQFDPPGGAFLVAYVDGEPAGCGGWRTFAEDPSLAEIKRLFVRPSARGRGVAMAILRKIEDLVRESGRSRAILETGDRQPEAIAMYKKMGYVRIPDFGHYKGEPGVLSFGRDL